MRYCSPAMPKPVLFSLILMGLIATPASAERWRIVARAGEVTSYVDMTSVRRLGNRVRYWAEIRYPSAQPGGTVRFERIGYFQERVPIYFDRVRYLIEADCIERQYRVVRSRSLFEGRIIRSDGSDGASHRAARGTLADIVLDVACSFGPIPRDTSGDQRIRTTGTS